MIGISKWFAAAILSTSLIFAGNVAEARKKTKSHASHVHKKAKKKKRSASGSRRRSDGYTQASSYMEREPASSHSKRSKKSKHKTAKKKKSRYHGY